MALHIPSIALGFLGAYALSCVVILVLALVDDWKWERRERKARDEALDQLLADVAIRCIERPWRSSKSRIADK